MSNRNEGWIHSVYTASNQPILVHWPTCDAFLIHNVEDALLLRIQKEVSVPAIGVDRHGNGPSLPVALMPEEVQYSLEKNWIKLVKGRIDSEAPASSVLVEPVSHKSFSYKLVGMYYHIQQYLGITIDRNRKQREAAKKFEDRPMKRRIIEGEYTTALEDAKAIGWVFPVSHEAARKYAVYCDLRSKGYYLTSGAKFGGDFLAYTSDPMDVHAQLIVSVTSHDKEPISLLDMIAIARIGSTTKKEIMFASVSDSNSVHYATFNWMGNL